MRGAKDGWLEHYSKLILRRNLLRILRKSSSIDKNFHKVLTCASFYIIKVCITFSEWFPCSSSSSSRTGTWNIRSTAVEIQRGQEWTCFLAKDMSILFLMRHAFFYIYIFWCHVKHLSVQHWITWQVKQKLQDSFWLNSFKAKNTHTQKKKSIMTLREIVEKSCLKSHNLHSWLQVETTWMKSP